jgi:hypothetical protein
MTQCPSLSGIILACAVLFFCLCKPIRAQNPQTLKLGKPKLLNSGEIEFTILGDENRIFTLEASGNLQHWKPIFFDLTETTNLTITENLDRNTVARFYRSKSFPPNSATTEVHNGWLDSIWISNGIVEVVIVPNIGRVMQFNFIGEEGPFWENRSLDGQAPDPLSSSWKNFGGDKTWPAPQADWPAITPRSWPPPQAFDSMPVEAEIELGTVILTSPVDPHFGIRTIRRIQLAPEHPVMKITTTFEKVSGRARRVSVWVVAQLKNPDRIYVPNLENSIYPRGFNIQSATPPPRMRIRNGFHTFWRDPGSSHKVGFDGETMLWVGETQALKLYSPRSEGREYPDNNSSIEVYTNPDPDAYIEFETLGPLHTMNSGDRIHQTNIYTLYRRLEHSADKEAIRILTPLD